MVADLLFFHMCAELAYQISLYTKIFFGIFHMLTRPRRLISMKIKDE